MRGVASVSLNSAFYIVKRWHISDKYRQLCVQAGHHTCNFPPVMYPGFAAIQRATFDGRNDVDN